MKNSFTLQHENIHVNQLIKQIQNINKIAIFLSILLIDFSFLVISYLSVFLFLKYIEYINIRQKYLNFRELCSAYCHSLLFLF